MKVYIVLYWDGEAADIWGVFSSYELADNYVKSILSNYENSNYKNIFMDSVSIDEYVIDQP